MKKVPMRKVLPLLIALSLSAAVGAQKIIPPGYLLAVGSLAATYRGNEYNDRNVINGIDALFHAALPTVDAFDPVWNGGGLNYEHIISFYPNTQNHFSPRSGPFVLSVIDSSTVRLTRLPQDEYWKVGAVVTFHQTAPHYIGMDVRLTAQDASLFGDVRSAVFMWASYMNVVTSTSIYFIGVAGPGEPDQWIVGNPPDPGGTFRHVNASALVAGGGVPDEYLASLEWPKYRYPFYCGQLRNNMGYELMFDKTWSETEELRLTDLKYKVKADPPNPKPAWDFQYVKRNIVSAEEFGFRMRAIYKPWISLDDCQGEYDTWAAAGFPL